MDPLDLTQRTGLPETLRVLLADYPREGWQADPNFRGLVEFWLDRHLMFRKLLDLMQTETALLLDRQSEPVQFAKRLSHYGSRFVGDMHGHHQIEDQHYFPLLATKDARIVKGFDILDHDHHALDGLLDGFVRGANTVLQSLEDREVLQTSVGRFSGDLDRLERLIDRHLNDEEEIVVPVILRHGAGSLG